MLAASRRLVFMLTFVVVGAACGSAGDAGPPAASAASTTAAATGAPTSETAPSASSADADAPPPDCVAATDATIDISDRSVHGDPVANTVLGDGITTVEVALVEVGRTCGQSHAGWALSELIVWAGTELQTEGDSNAALVEFVDGFCAELPQLPELTAEANAVCGA